MQLGCFTNPLAICLQQNSVINWERTLWRWVFPYDDSNVSCANLCYVLSHIIYIWGDAVHKIVHLSLGQNAPEKATRAKSAGTNIIEGGYSHMTMLAILAEMLKDSNVYWVELCYILR